MDVKIYEDETLDDLQFKGLKLIQKKSGFRFGIDAVLVSSFADIKKNDRVADLGTGIGIIPVLLAGKTEASKIIGLEIQEHLCETARRNVIMNKISDRVEIVCGDIRTFQLTDICQEHKSFDVVVSNPPYMNKGGGLLNPSDELAASRHELLCTLEDVIVCAKRFLVHGGQLAMVHRPTRLTDIICLMRKYGIEPKYMRLVCPGPDKEPNLVLIKGLKGGKSYLRVMKTLYVHNEKGMYTDEINNIYQREVVQK